MRTLAALCLALALAAPAEAKEFTTLVLTGARGDSVQLGPAPAVFHGLFSSRERVPARGGFVRVYVLGPDGLPGVPGRFYPATRALCLDWRRARPPLDCRRPHGRTASALARGAALALFRGAPPTLRRLERRGRPVSLTNLLVAVELAFDRGRLARREPTPSSAVRFSAAWRDGERPRDLCIGPRGVYAGGRLYPLGPAAFYHAAQLR